MNIVIVYPMPDVRRHPRFGFSYELLQIATVLNQSHSVMIKDFSSEEYFSNWFEELDKYSHIDLVLVECDSFALKRSQNIKNADEILRKVNPHVKTIAYGNYCYITQKDFSVADITIKTNDINLIIQAVNSFDRSIQLKTINLFDDLPYIDRDLLVHIPYYKEHSNCTLLQTAKGCENTCIFCQRKGWQKKYVSHSDEYVIQELEFLKSRGYTEIWIIDENFTFNLLRAKRLLRLIADRRLTECMHLFISSWANIDDDFINLATEANVRIISFGIESGNKEILDFYRKNIDISVVPEIIQKVNNAGIFTVGNFIIGAPTESVDTINQTFELICKCQFDQVNIKILDYMIGSVLYESLDDKIKKEDSVFSCKENGLTNFYLEDMKQMKDDFLKRYYDQHKPIIAQKIRIYGKPYEI